VKSDAGSPPKVIQEVPTSSDSSSASSPSSDNSIIFDVKSFDGNGIYFRTYGGRYIQ
jgi:hypothetical protein